MKIWVWGAHCGIWHEALDVVKAVDRDNFGLCLHGSHLYVALWADPFTQSGVRLNGARALRQSLRDLIQRFPLAKSLYRQLSDGEHLDPPYCIVTLLSSQLTSGPTEPGYCYRRKEFGGYMSVAMWREQSCWSLASQARCHSRLSTG